MKTFEPSFFDTQNFISEKKEFNYLPAESHNTCHVAFNVTDNFIMMAGVACVSVLENNKDMSFVFHIFTDGYSKDSQEKINELAKQWQCTCILYQLNMTPFEDFHIKVARFSRITYARIYMPKVLKGLTRRFLYMDADTACMTSLKELFALDLGGAPMAAISEDPHSVEYRSAHLKLKSGKYFNDGVMLIDVEEWERQHITEQAFSYQCEPKQRFLGQSQDVLNLVFDGQNCFFPSYFVALGGGEQDKEESLIVHWTGRDKPWNMVLYEADRKWRIYNALSPWDTITNILPIKKPENYHDFRLWGQYQQRHGNTWGHIVCLFWYSWLRMRYKLKL